MFKIKKFVVVQTHANKKIAGMARLITDNNLREKKTLNKDCYYKKTQSQRYVITYSPNILSK